MIVFISIVYRRLRGILSLTPIPSSLHSKRSWHTYSFWQHRSYYMRRRPSNRLESRNLRVAHYEHLNFSYFKHSSPRCTRSVPPVRTMNSWLSVKLGVHFVRPLQTIHVYIYTTRSRTHFNFISRCSYERELTHWVGLLNVIFIIPNL